MVPLPEGLKTFMARLETFLTPQTVPKRRASNSKKKIPTSVTWPHATPTPEELAYAGFYYKPTAESIDNVQCIVCNSQMDQWDPPDVPAFEHLKNRPDCGWAINACIRLRLGDPDRVEKDPMSEEMLEARRATYMDSWPHEDKKGWKPKVKKMIEAGWCYDPSPDADDGASCHYCQLALDGWEPKDDPMLEHRKRSEDCLFFALVDEYAATRKPAMKKKAKSSRSSKGSRLSTQSNLTSMSEAPTLMSIDEIIADVDDSIMTTTSNATTTSTTKGRKGKAKAASKTTRKPRGSKAVSTSDSVVIEQYVAPTDMDYEMEIPKPEAKGRARRNTRQASTTQMQDSSVMMMSSPPQRATRTRTTRTKAQPRMSDDQSQLQSEHHDALTKAPGHESEHDTPKPKRGTKRLSDGTAKADSPIPILEDESQPVEAPVPKLKRAKNNSKKAQGPTPIDSSDMMEAVEFALAPKAAPKARKGKKITKKTEDTIMVEPTLDDFPAPPSSARLEPSPVLSLPPSSFRGNTTPHQSTPRPRSDEASPEQPTPTPVRSSHIVISKTPRTAVRGGQTPVHYIKASTPSGSPQSDVENQPPSARPASVRPPLSVRQGNFASPTKRAGGNEMLDGFASSMPWMPVDLDSVFLRSPAAPTLESALDKENFFQMSGEAEAMKVREGLTGPEKKMTVEEWIFYNAIRGEEKLRAECERKVGVFETEGGRALLALEGIQCIA